MDEVLTEETARAPALGGARNCEPGAEIVKGSE